MVFVKLKLLFPIVSFGLAIGYVGSQLIWSPPSRAERTIDVFKAICVARYLGEPDVSPLDLGFEESLSPDGQRVWIDGITALFLSLNETSCSLSTYAPHALKKWEAEQTLSLLEPLVSEVFPDLPHDPRAQMGSIHKGWMVGEVGSQQRWGISFFAYPEWGDSAGSILSLSSPKQN